MINSICNCLKGLLKMTNVQIIAIFFVTYRYETLNIFSLYADTYYHYIRVYSGNISHFDYLNE